MSKTDIMKATQRQDIFREVKNNIKQPRYTATPEVVHCPSGPESVHCSSRQDSGCLSNRHGIAFWDPQFQMTRRPLVPGRTYHFNVIYNHAWCPLSRTEDTDLAIRVTTGLVERLELKGYVNSYYYDRDHKSEVSFTQELERVLNASSVTILLITPGFIHDCLTRYLSISIFQQLLAATGSRWRLITLSVDVPKERMPEFLVRDEVLYFQEDWEFDIPTWDRFDRAIGNQLSGSTRNEAWLVDDARKNAKLSSENTPEFVKENKYIQGQCHSKEKMQFCNGLTDTKDFLHKSGTNFDCHHNSRFFPQTVNCTHLSRDITSYNKPSEGILSCQTSEKHMISTSVLLRSEDVCTQRAHNLPHPRNLKHFRNFGEYSTHNSSDLHSNFNENFWYLNPHSQRHDSSSELFLYKKHEAMFPGSLTNDEPEMTSLKSTLIISKSGTTDSLHAFRTPEYSHNYSVDLDKRFLKSNDFAAYFNGEQINRKCSLPSCKPGDKADGRIHKYVSDDLAQEISSYKYMQPMTSKYVSKRVDQILTSSNVMRWELMKSNYERPDNDREKRATASDKTTAVSPGYTTWQSLNAREVRKINKPGRYNIDSARDMLHEKETTWGVNRGVYGTGRNRTRNDDDDDDDDDSELFDDLAIRTAANLRKTPAESRHCFPVDRFGDLKADSCNTCSEYCTLDYIRNQDSGKLTGCNPRELDSLSERLIKYISDDSAIKDSYPPSENKMMWGSLDSWHLGSFQEQSNTAIATARVSDSLFATDCSNNRTSSGLYSDTIAAGDPRCTISGEEMQTTLDCKKKSSECLNKKLETTTVSVKIVSSNMISGVFPHAQSKTIANITTNPEPKFCHVTPNVVKEHLETDIYLNQQLTNKGSQHDAVNTSTTKWSPRNDTLLLMADQGLLSPLPSSITNTLSTLVDIVMSENLLETCSNKNEGETARESPQDSITVTPVSKCVQGYQSLDQIPKCEQDSIMLESITQSDNSESVVTLVSDSGQDFTNLTPVSESEQNSTNLTPVSESRQDSINLTPVSESAHNSINLTPVSESGWDSINPSIVSVCEQDNAVIKSVDDTQVNPVKRYMFESMQNNVDPHMNNSKNIIRVSVCRLSDTKSASPSVGNIQNELIVSSSQNITDMNSVYGCQLDAIRITAYDRQLNNIDQIIVSELQVDTIDQIPGSEHWLDNINQIPGPESQLDNIDQLPGPEDRLLYIDQIPGPERQFDNIDQIPSPEDQLLNVDQIPSHEDQLDNIEQISGPENQLLNIDQIAGSEQPDNIDLTPVSESGTNIIASYSESECIHGNTAQPIGNECSLDKYVPTCQIEFAQDYSVSVSGSECTDYHMEPVLESECEQDNSDPVTISECKDYHIEPVLEKSRRNNSDPILGSECTQYTNDPTSDNECTQHNIAHVSNSECTEDNIAPLTEYECTQDNIAPITGNKCTQDHAALTSDIKSTQDGIPRIPDSEYTDGNDLTVSGNECADDNTNLISDSECTGGSTVPVSDSESAKDSAVSISCNECTNDNTETELDSGRKRYSTALVLDSECVTENDVPVSESKCTNDNTESVSDSECTHDNSVPALDYTCIKDNDIPIVGSEYTNDSIESLLDNNFTLFNIIPVTNNEYTRNNTSHISDRECTQVSANLASDNECSQTTLAPPSNNEFSQENGMPTADSEHKLDNVVLTPNIDSVQDAFVSSLNSPLLCHSLVPTLGNECTQDNPVLKLEPKLTGDSTVPASGSECPQINTVPASGSECTQINTVPTSGSECPQINTVPASGSECTQINTVPASGSECTQINTVPASGSECTQTNTVPSSGSECTQINSVPKSGSECTQTHAVPTSGIECPQINTVPTSGSECTQINTVPASGSECTQINTVPTSGSECTQRNTVPASGSECTQINTVPASGSECTQINTVPASGSECTQINSVPKSGSECTQINTVPTSSSECTQINTVPASGSECTQINTVPASGSECAQINSVPKSGSECTHINTVPTSSSQCTHINTVPTSSSECTQINTVKTSGSECTHINTVPKSGSECTHINTVPTSSSDCTHINDVLTSGSECTQINTVPTSDSDCTHINTVLTSGSECTQISTVPTSGSDCRHINTVPPSGSECTHINTVPTSSSECTHINTVPTSSSECTQINTVKTSGSECTHINTVPKSGSECTHINTVPTSSSDCTHINNVLTSGSECTQINTVPTSGSDCTHINTVLTSGSECTQISTVPTSGSDCRHINTVPPSGSECAHINAAPPSDSGYTQNNTVLPPYGEWTQDNTVPPSNSECTQNRTVLTSDSMCTQNNTIPTLESECTQNNTIPTLESECTQNNTILTLESECTQNNTIPTLESECTQNNTIPTLESECTQNNTIPTLESECTQNNTIPTFESECTQNNTIPTLESECTQNNTIPTLESECMQNNTIPTLESECTQNNTIPTLESECTQNNTIPTLESECMQNNTIPTLESECTQNNTILTLESECTQNNTIPTLESECTQNNTILTLESECIQNSTIPTSESESIPESKTFGAHSSEIIQIYTVLTDIFECSQNDTVMVKLCSCTQSEVLSGTVSKNEEDINNLAGDGNIHFSDNTSPGALAFANIQKIADGEYHESNDSIKDNLENGDNIVSLATNTLVNDEVNNPYEDTKSESYIEHVNQNGYENAINPLNDVPRNTCIDNVDYSLLQPNVEQSSMKESSYCMLDFQISNEGDSGYFEKNQSISQVQEALRQMASFQTLEETTSQRPKVEETHHEADMDSDVASKVLTQINNHDAYKNISSEHLEPNVIRKANTDENLPDSMVLCDLSKQEICAGVLEKLTDDQVSATSESCGKKLEGTSSGEYVVALPLECFDGCIEHNQVITGTQISESVHDLPNQLPGSNIATEEVYSIDNNTFDTHNHQKIDTVSSNNNQVTSVLIAKEEFTVGCDITNLVMESTAVPKRTLHLNEADEKKNSERETALYGMLTSEICGDQTSISCENAKCNMLSLTSSTSADKVRRDKDTQTTSKHVCEIGIGTEDHLFSVTSANVTFIPVEEVDLPFERTNITSQIDDKVTTIYSETSIDNILVPNVAQFHEMAKPSRNEKEDSSKMELTDTDKDEADWKLPLIKGVCHALSTPDMPFLG